MKRRIQKVKLKRIPVCRKMTTFSKCNSFWPKNYYLKKLNIIELLELYLINTFNAKYRLNFKMKNNFDKSLLIEYAVFYGSIEIFNHLRLEGVKLTSSLRPLAIQGQNAKMIHFLEDNQVELEDKSYKQVFYESIKCHHNDIIFKIICFNYIQNHIIQLYSKSYVSIIFKIICFNYIQNHIIQLYSKSYLLIEFKINCLNEILINNIL